MVLFGCLCVCLDDGCVLSLCVFGSVWIYAVVEGPGECVVFLHFVSRCAFLLVLFDFRVCLSEWWMCWWVWLCASVCVSVCLSVCVLVGFDLVSDSVLWSCRSVHRDLPLQMVCSFWALDPSSFFGSRTVFVRTNSLCSFPDCLSTHPSQLKFTVNDHVPQQNGRPSCGKCSFTQLAPMHALLFRHSTPRNIANR